MGTAVLLLVALDLFHSFLYFHPFSLPSPIASLGLYLSSILGLVLIFHYTITTI